MKYKNKNGFTLVELIVTMTIISIMATGITSLYIAIDNTQRKSRLLETATRAGERKIEELRNNHYNSLENKTTDFSSELPSSLPSPKSGTITITEPTPDVKRVDLTITYKDGTKNRQVKLSSMIGVLGIGQ